MAIANKDIKSEIFIFVALVRSAQWLKFVGHAFIS